MVVGIIYIVDTIVNVANIITNVINVITVELGILFPTLLPLANGKFHPTIHQPP